MDPPKHITTRITGYIRYFVLKGTITHIAQTQLAQPKSKGGVALQDIRTRAITNKIRYIQRMIENTTQNPLANFFFQIRLNQFRRIDLTSPHYNGKLPRYYQDCLELVRKYTDLINKTDNPKNIYTEVLQTRHTKPLHETIKRWRQHPHTNLHDSFQNLYLPQLTNKQREITYRILYNITPTSSGLARKTGRLKKCTTCKRNIQETEEHIFYTCPHVKIALKSLDTILRLKSETPTNLHQAIFLNTIDKQINKNTEHIKLIIIALYRHTIWTVRLKTSKQNQSFTPIQVFKFFIANVYRNLQKHDLEDIFWELSGGAD